MTKNCPRCKAIFDCQHNANCWCSKYIIPEKLRLFLKENYDDCICENCLRELI